MNEYVVTALAILISMGVGLILLIEFGVSWVGYFVIVVISLSWRWGICHVRCSG